MEAVATKVATILFSQYGVLGICVVGLVLFILKLMREHAKERAELVASLKSQGDTMLDAFEKNTTVLTEVKTLISTISR
jgi:hypothetical protein